MYVLSFCWGLTIHFPWDIFDVIHKLRPLRRDHCGRGAVVDLFMARKLSADRDHHPDSNTDNISVYIYIYDGKTNNDSANTDDDDDHHHQGLTDPF